MVLDSMAASYDADFTQIRVAKLLRSGVWSRLDEFFEPGMRVLEIGCGTGEDAHTLARLGRSLLAGDGPPVKREEISP